MCTNYNELCNIQLYSLIIIAHEHDECMCIRPIYSACTRCFKSNPVPLTSDFWHIQTQTHTRTHALSKTSHTSPPTFSNAQQSLTSAGNRTEQVYIHMYLTGIYVMNVCDSVCVFAIIPHVHHHSESQPQQRTLIICDLPVPIYNILSCSKE